MQLATIDLSEEFLESLKQYIQFLELPWTIEVFDPKKEYKLTDPLYLLAHNHTPEDMKVAARFFALRNEPQLCAIPMIFASEPLAPLLASLCEDKEFIWTLPLPFNSAYFFSLIKTVQEFKEKNQEILILRSNIAHAVAKSDYAEANSFLKKIDSKYPFPFQLLLLRSLVSIGLGKLEAAEGFLEKACQLKPESFEANSQLAKVYHMRNKPEAFKKSLEKTAKAAEIYVKNLIHWGNIYLERGEGDKSQTAFERAAEKDAANLEVQEGLLASNLMNGNIEMVQKIMDNSPNSLELARLCNLKGIAMAKSGSFAAAEKLYKNAMKFLPDDEVVYKLWFNLGLSMKLKKDYKKALFYFERAKKAAPDDFEKVSLQIRIMKDALALTDGAKRI